MSRPASLRPQVKFIGKAAKAGSKKLEIDWDMIEESYNHNMNDQINRKALARLRLELIDAEARGLRKTTKIRREINKLLEQNLALGVTWCQGCLNYLHRCKCQGFEEQERRRIRKNRLARERTVANRHQRILDQFRQKFQIKEV